MIDAKRKAILFLTISFLLAVITAGVILVQINQAQQRLGKTVSVAAASTDIKSYHEIKDSEIKWVELPESSAYDSFITNEQDLKEAISVVALKEGELLTNTLIRKKLEIPENDRVVWLNATEIVLIDQQVTEGDLVDIIVSQNMKDTLETKRFFQNVRVVQVEEQSEGAPRIKISLSIENAEKLIHFQNSAIQIRVLRVNQASSGEELQEVFKESATEESESKETSKTSDGSNSNSKEQKTTNKTSEKTIENKSKTNPSQSESKSDQ